MKTLIVFVITVALYSSSKVLAEINGDEIYSLDQVVDENTTLALTVDAETKIVSLKQLSSSNGHQRFIARINSDKTFTLFLEAQPWNWVEHIVERTKYVNIQIIPEVLGVIGGSKEVVEQKYAGTGSSAQTWYIVPTGDDPNTGVLTSMLLRQCLTGQGEGQPLTLAVCNWSDPNQIFTFQARTSGRHC